MNRVLLTMSVAGVILAGVNQQAGAQTALRRNCGSFEYLQQQLAAQPALQEQRRQIESFTEQYVRSHNLPTGKQTAAIYNIPVVVHVLYNSATNNISDAQILSQIDVLNKDFQLLNPDAAGVPAAFAGLKADCQIQFCMAQRTPQGTATNGIVRKSTTKASFSVEGDDAKSSTTGGDNAWDRSQYLNLWVVPALTSNGQSGVLGYAQFPGGPAGTDGVVIGHNYFGTTGTAAAPFNKGRTATHEIGHWLNLNHIWGDDGNACTGTDNVGDTPNQGDENYGCPSFPTVSCSNGPNGDMFMNYMDYTDDACMFMFSSGQKSRMHAVLAPGGFRASITTSQGCSAPTGSTTCGVPYSLNVSGLTATGATLSWTGNAAALSYNLQWKATNAATWNTVAGITATSYTLSGLSAGTGYQFQVMSNCSGDASAYSSPVAFTTPAACSDIYESNNTRTAAAAISVNTTITARIGASNDKDYYKFTNTSAAPRIRISLANLPADYDVRLYNASGSQVGISQNGGTTAETIVYNTSVVGTWYVYVYGYSNAYSATQCYNLTAETSASSFREADGGATLKTGSNSITLFPNPARSEVYFDYYSSTAASAQVNIVDQSGRIVKSVALNLDEGGNQPKISVSELPAGLYFVRMMAGDQIITAKLLIQQ